MDLAEKIVSLFRSGPLVQFECDPSTVLWDRNERVVVKAVIFVDPTVPRRTWDPVAICKEKSDLKIKLTQQPSSRPERRVFQGSIAMSEVAARRYTLELHGYSDEPAIAATTLLILDKQQTQALGGKFPPA